MPDEELDLPDALFHVKVTKQGSAQFLWAIQDLLLCIPVVSAPRDDYGHGFLLNLVEVLLC